MSEKEAKYWLAGYLTAMAVYYALKLSQEQNENGR